MSVSRPCGQHQDQRVLDGVVVRTSWQTSKPVFFASSRQQHEARAFAPQHVQRSCRRAPVHA